MLCTMAYMAGCACNCTNLMPAYWTISKTILPDLAKPLLYAWLESPRVARNQHD